MSCRVELSVISPCLNENKNLIELTRRLQKVFEKEKISGEIILVNDGSTDDTATIMEQLSSKFTNVKIFHHEKNRGIEQGWKTGLSNAKGVYVCLIDSDMQNLPEDVGRLYREIKFSNVDLVQGWRNHIGRLQDSFLRHWSSRGLNFILNTAFGMHSRDNKSGFVICRKEVLKDILTHKFKYNYYQAFITVAIKYKGYSLKEVETLFQNRLFGKSFIGNNLKVIFLTLIDIFKAFIEFRYFQTFDDSLEEFISKEKLNPSRQDNWTFFRKLYFRLYIFLFPLHHWFISKDSYKYYKSFKKGQWLSPKTIKEYQESKLRKLITHAYYHVPFYRDLFDRNNLKPEDINTLEDLPKLPIIDKSIVRDNIYLGMLSDNHNKNNLQKVQTSGSTGEPFYTFAEKKQLEMRWAATQRAFEWAGHKFGDRQVRLWHKYLGMKPLEVVREVIDAFLSRRKFIPAYEISDNNLKKYVESVMSYRPTLLDGYAESFNFLARYLKRNEYSGHRPKAIISSAQSMPDESRQIIESTFGCGVYDKYGSREFGGGMAYQCSERNGYHIVAECNIIEIIKNGVPALPGEVGEIVITELNNFAMPLIRYSIGDLGVKRDPNEVCKCGRGLPLIGNIQGRVQSIVIGSNKQFIPGTFFNRIFFKHDLAVKQYQVVQEEAGKLLIKIIQGNLFTEDALKIIVEDIKNYMGSDMDIKIEFVDEIPLGKTGKRQHCISKIDPLSLINNTKNVSLQEKMN